MAVITISRQFGSGGKKVGKRVADELGYYYADEDIIERAAVEANLSPDWITSIEKSKGGKIQNLISKLKPFGKSLMERPLDDKEGYIDGSKYVDLLHKIIPRVAAEGNAVIIGRGGQYILKDFDNVYHFLFIADQKDRIQFIKLNYNISDTEAAKIERRMAKRRANLYSFFGRKDYDDLTLYHMVFNMSKLSMEEAEELIYELIKQ